ncbi:MAG: hypothetical protein MZV70_44715 [Desulfobacterales bacterium]|nr:hypothetical protein [Desulfobacterales bacterium]
MGHLQAALGRQGAQADRLAAVRRLARHQPVRQRLLLLGVLHVRHQGRHDRQGARPRRSGLHHLQHGHPQLRQGLREVLQPRDKTTGIRFVQLARALAWTCCRRPDDLSLRYVDEAGEPAGSRSSTWWCSRSACRCPKDTVELAERLGRRRRQVPASPSRRPFTPVETSRPGVYACGVFQGPKDIPSSVTEASAAAAWPRATLAGRPATR